MKIVNIETQSNKVTEQSKEEESGQTKTDESKNELLKKLQKQDTFIDPSSTVENEKTNSNHIQTKLATHHTKQLSMMSRGSMTK